MYLSGERYYGKARQEHNANAFITLDHKCICSKGGCQTVSVLLIIHRSCNLRSPNLLHEPSLILSEHSCTMALPDVGAPINTVLILLIIYYTQKILLPPTPSLSPSKKPATEFKQNYSWMPSEHPPTILYKTYTPKTLAPFDGKDGGRILLAIKGKVFDVSGGRSFYGPG